MSISNEKIKKTFGANLRHLRIERDLSQEDLAFQIGLHRTYIGSVERGERNISLVNIVKIMTALEIPVSELFKGIES